VLEAEKNSLGYRRLEIDPEGGQDHAWTEEPVEKDEDYFITNFHSYKHCIIYIYIYIHTHTHV